MHTTRLTFLDRLSDGNEAAWRDFAAAYKPMLRRWLRHDALNESDMEDLIQEVMLFVATHLEGFSHNTRTGAFRKWLRSVTVNLARNYLRKHQRERAGNGAFMQLLGQLEDDASQLSIAFEQDYQRALLRELLRRIESGFAPETISMFRQYVLEEHSVAETAATHGVTKAAVYVAKSKVMRRLREEWQEEFGG
jgi:RNA polymerase sigma-70 factor (ECF subfamily)